MSPPLFMACRALYVSSHSISPSVWSNRQKNDGFVHSILTKTILTCLDMPTFFTDNKNYPKVSIHPSTAAST